MARVPTNDDHSDYPLLDTTPAEPPGQDDRQGSGEETAGDGAITPVKKSKRGGAKSAHAPLSVVDGWDELELEPITDDRSVYRMSNLGGDLTQLVAGALQIQQALPPTWLAKYMDEGTEAEGAIIAAFYEQMGGGDAAMRRATYPELAQLKSDGVIAGYDPNFDVVAGTGGPQVRLEVGKSAVVRGHPDDIVRINPNGDEPAFGVIEAKKFRPTLWGIWNGKRDWSADPVLEKYAWQVSALHHATGLPVYFVVGQFNPDTTMIDSIDVLLITEKNVPHTLGEIKARVMKAQKHVNEGDIPPCDRADATCPYRDTDHCLGKSEKSYEDVDDTELGKLLSLYYAYSVDVSKTDEQREAEKLRKAVKDQIDKHMAEKGYARTKGDDTALMHVWDEAGNEYEYEWVTYEMSARPATTANKINVKLVLDTGAVAPEDHPE